MIMESELGNLLVLDFRNIASRREGSEGWSLKIPGQPSEASVQPGGSVMKAPGKAL